MAGYDELSTLPRSCFVIVGISPLVPFVELTTDQVTFGVFGVRP
jgi:hypothetical protein